MAWMTASWLFLVLSIALVLTTATQWRLESLPLGLGELSLSVWLFLTAVGMYLGRKQWLSSPSPALKSIASFWGIAWVLLVAGGWYRDQLGLPEPEGVMHDGLAYLFVCCVSLAMAWWPLDERPLSHLARTLVLIMLGSLSMLWLAAQLQIPWTGLNYWYGPRFSGWATNPNQMALLAVMLPFLMLHFLRPGRKSKLYLAGWIVALALVFVAGWATDSGALRMAWLSGIPALVLLYSLNGREGWIARIERLSTLIAALIFAWLLTGVVSPSDAVVSPADEFHAPIVTDNTLHWKNDAPVRLVLLKHGWQALLFSPWTGLGPGSFSGLEAPFQGSEAHNSLLDMGMSTGLLGITALLWLVSWLLYRLWKARQVDLFVALLALCVFALGHHVLRHPLVWVWLALMIRMSNAKSDHGVG